MKLYSIEELNYKSDKMFEYLRQMLESVSDEEKTFTRLMHLGRMLSESGEYKAACGYQIDTIVHGEIAKAIDTAMGDKVSASIINKYVTTACKEWNYLYNSFDRINSAAAKQMMGIQTMVSYEKSKLNIR